MTKKDKFELLKPEVFKYQQEPVDDLTPGFIFGVALTILAALALLVLFAIWFWVYVV